MRDTICIHKRSRETRWIRVIRTVVRSSWQRDRHAFLLWEKRQVVCLSLTAVQAWPRQDRGLPPEQHFVLSRSITWASLLCLIAPCGKWIQAETVQVTRHREHCLYVCVWGGLKAENVFNFILLNPTNTCSVVSDPIRDVTWKSSTHQRFLNYGVLQCFNRQMSIDSHSVEQSHHTYICIYCFSFFFYFKESGWLMGSVCAVVALHCPHCC